MNDYYSTLTTHELLDEYFHARLDYHRYVNERNWDKNEEIGSILIQNYQEIEAEIEKRTYEYDSCKE